VDAEPLIPGLGTRMRHVLELLEGDISLLPLIDAEWAATGAAAAELDAELPVPLGEILSASLRAVGRRPFRQRIADAARSLGDPALAPLLADSTHHD
jgi:hypothetical protein